MQVPPRGTVCQVDLQWSHRALPAHTRSQPKAWLEFMRRVRDRPCIHEHSCLRCPLLRPDPDERDRLTQIRDNLLDRIAEAETNRWFGEVEGLKVSLAGARDKLAQMDQITTNRNTAVHLGIPTFSDAAGRASRSGPAHNQNH